MRISIKEGVVFKEINMEAVYFFDRLDRVWGSLDLHELRLPVITSANDGTHKTTSLHYHDLAWDIRTRDLNDVLVKSLSNRLAKLLGTEWDVVIEKDHVHVEYDPKER